MMKSASRSIALALAFVPALALASGWEIDPAHTSASFTVKHMVISNVRGEFGRTTGRIDLDEKDLTKSRAEATIDVTSLDTHVEKRDQHLRSPDFFDAATYPTITFKSTKVQKAGKGKLKITGDLTMKDVTKPVVLDVSGPTAEVKGPMGETRRAFSATTKISRKDFHLMWDKTFDAGPLVGDEVNIELSLELVKAQDTPKAEATAQEESKKAPAKP